MSELEGDIFGAHGGAVFSKCSLYRYLLQRVWDARLQTLNFVMLNPSTADANKDDATIRRCIGFARDLGYGALEVTNLFALRSTNPKVLRGHKDPVGGQDNDWAIVNSAKACQLTICAWGNHGRYLNRGNQVLDMLRKAGIKPHALKIGQYGDPAHPLYLKSDLKPIRIP